jgi:hypothetical protein
VLVILLGVGGEVPESSAVSRLLQLKDYGVKSTDLVFLHGAVALIGHVVAYMLTMCIWPAACCNE